MSTDNKSKHCDSGTATNTAWQFALDGSNSGVSQHTFQKQSQVLDKLLKYLPCVDVRWNA